MNIKEHCYKNKKVYLGMDVHKKTYVIVAICDGQVVKKWTTKASPHCICQQVKRFFIGAEIFSAYEAGFSGFRLHRELCTNGVNSIVVNAASIEVQSNNRVKTDKRDATKIAEHLSTGRLRCIYIPSIEEEHCRSLSRGREQVVRRRQAIGNQIKMKLHYIGYELPDEKKMSEVFAKWAGSLNLSSENKFVINELIESWRDNTKRINRYNKALLSQSSKDKFEEIYRSAPGIGAVSSRVLSNELGDMSRFTNEKHLFSYSGLTPSEYSSGEKVRKGHITRQGSPRLRATLIEVAWRSIASDRSLREFYIRIKKNREGKRAIVAVARKILGRLRKCLKDNTKWRDLSIVQL